MIYKRHDTRHDKEESDPQTDAETDRRFGAEGCGAGC
jgi:hypothetical protein